MEEFEHYTKEKFTKLLKEEGITNTGFIERIWENRPSDILHTGILKETIPDWKEVQDEPTNKED